jgi:hypothetical protein
VKGGLASRRIPSSKMLPSTDSRIIRRWDTAQPPGAAAGDRRSGGCPAPALGAGAHHCQPTRTPEADLSRPGTTVQQSVGRIAMGRGCLPVALNAARGHQHAAQLAQRPVIAVASGDASTYPAACQPRQPPSSRAAPSRRASPCRPHVTMIFWLRSWRARSRGTRFSASQSVILERPRRVRPRVRIWSTRRAGVVAQQPAEGGGHQVLTMLHESIANAPLNEPFTC